MSKMSHNYSVIKALWDCSLYDRPATIKEIKTALAQQQKKCAERGEEAETPSDSTVERLLSKVPNLKGDSIRKQVSRSLNDAGRFLSPEMGGHFVHRDLTLFQIFRYRTEKNELKQICFDSEDKNSTQAYSFCLGYNIDPKQLGLKDERGNLLTQSRYMTEDMQRQISARMQFVLDAILDFQHIGQADAKNLRDVLGRACTLGEIPDHIQSAKDRENIDFRVLSRLTTDLQSAHKHKSIANTASRGISCLEITMGEYTTDKAGNLILAAGRVIRAYPVLTRFFDGHYYVAVVIPEDNDNCEYLRIDHIISCTKYSSYPARKREELDVAIDITEYLYGAATKHYTITACPDSVLVDIIDAFGKSSLFGCGKDENGWRFTIRIPNSRERQLKSLLDEQHIEEWKTDKEMRSTAIPHNLLGFQEGFAQGLREWAANRKINFNTLQLAWEIYEFDVPERELIEAIRNQDRQKVLGLLAQRTKQLTPAEAAWCCYLAMAMDAQVLKELLRFCPEAERFISYLPATAMQCREGLNLNLVSFAACYDLLEHMKLLVDFGASVNAAVRDGDATPLRVAIRESSVNCLNYLLFECPDVDKSVTEEMLYLFAHAASDGKTVDPGYEIAAPVLLGCNVSAKGFSPFPEGMNLKHIAEAANMPLLLQYCNLRPDELTKDDAKCIMHHFIGCNFADTSPEGFVKCMAVIARACPSILRVEKCKYLLAVAGLQKGKMPAQLPSLLKSIHGSNIIMQDYAYHNWFGRDGMIHRWERLNDPSVGRKSPLLPAIYRNTPPPCDPDAVSTAIMDTILTKFTILGKATVGSLSVLARYALKFASKENIENALRPGGFLADEDPNAIQLFVESLKDASAMSTSRRDMLIDMFKEKH